MFRAIDIKTGEKVFGNLVQLYAGEPYFRCYIIQNNYTEAARCGGELVFLKNHFWEVHPDSMAMNTGIEDKNQKPIYGSILIDGKISHGGDILGSSNDGKDDCDVWEMFKIGNVFWNVLMGGFNFGILDLDDDNGVYSIKYTEIIGTQWDCKQ